MSPKAQYIRWADQAARQHGIDPGILKALISHESGWKRNARSPAGALGIAQFMPGTAKGLGINPLNPKQAIFGAAKYLAGKIQHYGDVKLALASYNAGDGAVQKYGGIPPFAETQHYVHAIMRDAGHYQDSASTGTPQRAGTTITTPNGPDLAQVALGNLAQMSSQGGHFDPYAGLDNLVQAISMAGSTTTQVPGEQQAAPTGDWGKYVKLAAGADRKGAHTDNGVKQFVGELGASLGHPLTITTGTNHNQNVVGTNRQSAHWTGHAADIALSGDALTRAGRRALILAGMSPKRAAKIKGGLFNIGGYQIIFNTNEGGNHFNHLHVGQR